MYRRTFIALNASLATSALAWQQRALRIAVLTDGSIYANSKVIDLVALDKLLTQLEQDDGVVWYYRQNPSQEPHPQALEVIKLVTKHSLPVSMSTKPDFSDYVDASGNSKPRW